MNLLRKITHNIRGKVIINNYKNMIASSDKVIDIGSNTGFIAKQVYDCFKCNMECSDVINNLECNLPFHLIKDFKIDVPDKSFDIAMINDVLHHVQSDKQLLIIKEAERISKKVLIFETQYNFIVEIIEKINERKGMPCPRAFRDLGGWKILLKDFKCVEAKKPFYYPIASFVLTKIQQS